MSIEIKMLHNVEYACIVENWLIDYENENGHGLNRQRVEKGADLPGIYALKNDALIGGLTFRIQNDWIFLCCGFVLPEYRGKRIYSTFMYEMEALAKKNKLSGIHVSTYTFEAPHIYEHLGFSVGAILKDLPKGNTNIDYYKQMPPEPSDLIRPVRCGECRYYHPDDLNDEICHNVNGLTEPADDDYCSYGLRKAAE